MGFWQSWRGWREYRGLAPEWKRIVFYSESGQDWHFFDPLITALTRDLDRSVTYVSSDAADPGLAQRHKRLRAICIPEGLFLTIHFQVQRAGVVVLTMMDLGNLNLKRSIHPVHYVYLFHSMGSTHMVDHADSYDGYDSFLCVGPHHVAELRRREELQSMPARNLFQFGYPRLETLMAQAQQHAERPSDSVPTVLVAPTWGPDSIFNACGSQLLEALLTSGLRVIMRPHYQTRKRTPAVIEQLLAEFGAHPRFELIEQMGETGSLFRSDLLISDWSAMAIEYALGLEKPVLFIDLPRRVRNPDWQALGLEPLEAAIREEVGVVISRDRLSAVPEAVRGLLQDRAAFRARMTGLRQRLVFNLGRSVPLGARELARLADQQQDALEAMLHGGG